MGIFADIKYHLHMLEAVAFNRKDAMDFVESQQDEIIKHLIKIAIYSDIDRGTQVRHWQNKILGWLEQINIKGNSLKKGSRLKLRDYILCLQCQLCNYTDDADKVGAVNVLARFLAESHESGDTDPLSVKLNKRRKYV